MKSSHAKTLLAAALLAATAAQARAEVYTFDCISNNALINCTSGEGQLSFTTSAYSSPTLSGTLFTFANLGPLASSITDIYFDFATGLSTGLTLTILTESAGVDFSLGATPPDLPAGNNATPDFEVTAGFSADSNSGSPGVQANGINPTESLALLLSPVSLATVTTWLSTGDLRLGVHVQGFSNGGSESFVNGPPGPGPTPGIPTPGTLALLGLGLVALGARHLKRG